MLVLIARPSIADDTLEGASHPYALQLNSPHIGNNKHHQLSEHEVSLGYHVPSHNLFIKINRVFSRCSFPVERSRDFLQSLPCSTSLRVLLSLRHLPYGVRLRSTSILWSQCMMRRPRSGLGLQRLAWTGLMRALHVLLGRLDWVSARWMRIYSC